MEADVNTIIGNRGLHGYAVGDRLRKVETLIAVLPLESGLAVCAIGLEDSAPPIHGFHRLTAHGEATLQVLTILVIDLESHTVGHALHQVAAFGIERDNGLGFLVRGTEHAAQGTRSHVLHVFSLLARMVIDGKDTRIEFVVVAIVFVHHLVAQEPTLGILRMVVLVKAPVELPPRVGAELIVASIERIEQDNGTIALTLLHLHLLPLHKIAVLVEQLDIEQLTQRRRTPVAQAHVCLVIECVAQIIAGIVHVDEDFFLWNLLAEELQPLGPAIEGGGILPEGQQRNNQQIKKERAFHYHKNVIFWFVDAKIRKRTTFHTSIRKNV